MPGKTKLCFITLLPTTIKISVTASFISHCEEEITRHLFFSSPGHFHRRRVATEYKSPALSLLNESPLPPATSSPRTFTPPVTFISGAQRHTFLQDFVISSSSTLLFCPVCQRKCLNLKRQRAHRRVVVVMVQHALTWHDGVLQAIGWRSV